MVRRNLDEFYTVYQINSLLKMFRDEKDLYENDILEWLFKRDNDLFSVTIGELRDMGLIKLIIDKRSTELNRKRYELTVAGFELLKQHESLKEIEKLNKKFD